MGQTTLPANSASEMWSPASAGEYSNTKPPLSRAPYSPTPGGYADRLAVSPGSTPDPYRLGLSHYNPYTNDGTGNESTSANRNREHNSRENITRRSPLPLRTDGHNTPKFAPDPRATRGPITRMTETLTPSGYTSVRPFAQETPKRFTGQHFSMATHKRTTEIYGMAPANKWRTTRRDESVPHGTLNYDENTPSPYLSGGINKTPGTAPTSRNYMR